MMRLFSLAKLQKQKLPIFWATYFLRSKLCIDFNEQISFLGDFFPNSSGHSAHLTRTREMFLRKFMSDVQNVCSVDVSVTWCLCSWIFGQKKIAPYKIIRNGSPTVGLYLPTFDDRGSIV
jgi:hypothetical protein